LSGSFEAPDPGTVRARFSALRFMRPPYGKFSDRLLAFLTR